MNSASSVDVFHGLWRAPYMGFVNGLCTQNPLKCEDIDSYFVIDTQTIRPKVRVGSLIGTRWHLHSNPLRWSDTTYEEIENWVLAASSFLEHDPEQAVVETFYPFLKYLPPRHSRERANIIITCDYGVADGVATRSIAYVLLCAGPHYLEQVSASIDRASLSHYLTPLIVQPQPNDEKGVLSLFRYLFDRLYCFIATNAKENREVVGSYDRAKSVYHQYLSSEGRSFETAISHIWPSTNDLKCTEVFTYVFPYAPAGSTIFFHNTPVLPNDRPLVNAVSMLHFADTPHCSALHVDIQTRRSKIIIDLDTTGVKPMYWKKSRNTQPWLLRVKHRVHAQMEYAEFIAAVQAMQYDVFGVSQHTAYGAWMYKDRPFLPNTWLDLQQGLKRDQVRPAISRWRSNRVSASHFYHNPVVQCHANDIDVGLQALLQKGAIPYCHLNDPHIPLEDLGRGRHLDYSIVQENYLNNNIFRLYWKIAGPCRYPFQALLTHMGYKQNGSKFVGRASNQVLDDSWTVLGYDDGSEENQENPHTSFLHKPLSCSVRRQLDRLYVSHIVDNIKRGKTIGYMRISSFDWSDPLLLMSDQRMGGDTTAKSSRGGTENLCALFALLMRVMLDPQYNSGQPIHSVIIDIRGNSGGLAHAPWIASFFGDNRSGSDGSQAVSSSSRSSRLFADILKERGETSFRGTLEASDEMTRTIDVRESLKRYGRECVFQDGDLFILTDEAACSEGDEFVHYFLGDRLDRDIGGGVRTYLVGEVSGRIIGGTFCSITSEGLPTTSDFLKDNQGQVVNAIPLNRIENSSAGLTKIRGRPLSVQNQATAMDLLLPNTIEQVWQDIGLMPDQWTTRPAIRYEDRSTWRDFALDHIIDFVHHA